MPGSDGHPPSPFQSGSLCSALNGAMQGLHVQGGSSEMSGLPQTQLDDSSMQSGSLGGPQGAPRLRSAGDDVTGAVHIAGGPEHILGVPDVRPRRG